MIGPKAIIHLDRLKTNYDLVKKQVGNKPIMAVVKANGYGHGSIACAKALESHGCDYFSVFTIEEGIELRRAGIKSDILVFSRMDTARFAEAINDRLTLNISHVKDQSALISYIKIHGQCPKVHLKVDTGMTRLGIDINDAADMIEQLNDNPGIDCEGIYSHFATADEGDLSYAYEQESKFNSVLDKARNRGYTFKYVHFSNSGAALNMDQTNYNIVRIGMLLYGAFPSDEVPMDLNLQPVMEFRAPIVAVRNVPKGTQISYGGVYQSGSNTNIGVIQCGFADGFPRPWYESGYVSYRGNQFKIAGRICMDQFMVDFKDTFPTEGEEVLLIGENGKDSIRMETIAKNIQLTPYVIATAIGGRTQRIYQD